MNKKDIDNICFYIPLKKLRNSIRIVLEKIFLIDKKTDDILEKLYYQELRIDRSNNIISDMILFKDSKKVFYLQTPEHGNIGDHAIVYASQKIINEIYPDTVILEYSYNDFYYIFDYIKKFITNKDIIFLPGGGNMGNLYINEEDMRRNIVKSFSKNKIFVFPVSIYYSNDDEGNKQLSLSKEIYNKNDNLYIMTRDENSYNFAKGHFINNKIYLIPDAALYLYDYFNDFIESLDYSRRNGCIFILRNDKEKILDNNIINKLKNYLDSNDVNICNFDTFRDINITKNEREKYILEYLNIISLYNLCITDRFHGMIFSYITKTPCIVFDSFDTKIKYGYKIIEQAEYIHYIDKTNMSETYIYSIVDKYIKKYYNNKNIINLDMVKKISDIILKKE